jgi:hypothetical protein
LRETQKRAKNVTQCRLQKQVDEAKLKVRFCSLFDAVLEKMNQ